MNAFEHHDYRDLVDSLLQQKMGRGSKVKLAELLNCNPGYISQVLGKSKIHFSQENIIKISQFLKLSAPEEEFLMALLNLEKAGSKELQSYWNDKVKNLRKQHLKVEKQVKQVSQELTETEKATYYSHWAYSAIHVLISIDEFKTSDEVAKRIRIPRKLAATIVAFLSETKLIFLENGIYRIGKTRIHLKSDSPLVKSHHQNFRSKAIATLGEDNDFDLHYSAALTLSKKDALKIRQMLLKFLADKEEILIPSPNEEIIGLNFDLFLF